MALPAQPPLRKIGDFLYEIPQSFRKDMRVPARLFASDALISGIGGDRSLTQLVNIAAIPGIEGYAMAMPDIHEGYGFPIGGVVAVRKDDGIISPGGIGYDINCGVRLLRSDARTEDLAPKLEQFATQLQRDVPSGLGRGGPLRLGLERMDAVLAEGVEWMKREGYATEQDAAFCEGEGRLSPADADAVSDHAKRRGRDQLGTIGSGNHFVEVQRVEQIFSQDAANTFGFREGQVVVMVHCGSRGLGHQVATDYIRRFLPKLAAWKIALPDRELVGAPLSSPDGEAYFSAMNAAANFAFANRQFITHEIRGAWRRIFGKALGELTLVYDVAHNMGKREAHGGKELLVHRKGATRAFGPGREELPERYRAVGQPVFIPGSMGTASWVLAGTAAAEELSFATTCHGAGRLLSRKAAARQVPYERLLQELRKKGIVVRAGSARGLVEEAPEAYKDVEEVVRVVDEAGIAKKVARLVPLAVMKG